MTVMATDGTKGREIAVKPGIVLNPESDEWMFFDRITDRPLSYDVDDRLWSLLDYGEWDLAHSLDLTPEELRGEKDTLAYYYGLRPDGSFIHHDDSGDFAAYALREAEWWHRIRPTELDGVRVRATFEDGTTVEAPLHDGTVTVYGRRLQVLSINPAGCLLAAGAAGLTRITAPAGTVTVDRLEDVAVGDVFVSTTGNRYEVVEVDDKDECECRCRIDADDLEEPQWVDDAMFDHAERPVRIPDHPGMWRDRLGALWIVGPELNARLVYTPDAGWLPDPDGIRQVAELTRNAPFTPVRDA